MTTGDQRPGERPHGTRARYAAGPGPGRGPGCRCDACCTAKRAEENYRIRQIAYGRWHPYVDAEPARQHIAALAQAGIGWRRAAELAGLSDGLVSGLLYGRGGRPPTRRIRPATAQAILGVPAAPAPGALTDATGTRRRLQALVANGHSQAQLAARLGKNPNNFGFLLRRTQVTTQTRDAVRQVYDQLWNQPPAEHDPRSRQAAARARNYATARGWVPPLAWDDDLIDRPGARPAGDWRRPARTTHRRVELAEDAYELLALGHTREQAAERLGVKRTALEQALARTQRQHTARPTAGHDAQRALFADAATPAPEAGFQAEAG
jgi:transcriptional regulator with XRE-family HTH domain